MVSSVFWGGKEQTCLNCKEIIISVKLVDLFVHKGSTFNMIF